ncbi:cell envelope integrity protein TolA [Massilia sp. PWRC2]|uniref:cell envelope integrity protein TolA n=1 Tax=Massilia sp. PWRC2 TaxID=2804626 RepID=UPI003CF4A1D8
MATTEPAHDTPYRVPPEPRRWPSIALAAAVHLGLLAFLFIGVNWQNNQPVAVEAEVWDMKTQAAAPPPPPPQEIEAEPETAPPTPAPAPPPPPPVAVAPPTPAPPDIALERERKQAERKKLLAEEERAEEKRETERAAQEQKAQKKAQLAAEKKAQELADKKLADKKLAEQKLEAKRQEDKKLDDKKLEEKKLADKQKGDKLAKAKAEAAEQAKLDKLRDADMKRMLAGVGGTGEAAQSTAPKSDPGYIAAISAKVKSATSYTGNTDVAGNPAAEFRIEQLPSGEIMNVKLVKSSGVSGFDDAVEKGIIKASPLPKKKDGTVVRTLTIAFKMKDLN